MRFIFLGTGTSAGIPVIACDCPACVSEDPRDKRTRTGAALVWQDERGNERVVLIDTTPDLRAQALRHDLRRCDAILYTHNHVDHVFGLDEVRRFNAVMQAPIDVYAEAHTLETLRRVYAHVFEPEKNVNKSFVATLIAHELDADRPLDLWGVRFTPVRLMHGRLPIVGYRVEPAPRSRLKAGGFLPMAYCTDVSGVPTESWAKLEGLKTLVWDALRHKHHPTHMTVDQAVAAAAQIGAGQAWFVHMAHQIKHAEVDADLPDGMSLAWDGLTLG